MISSMRRFRDRAEAGHRLAKELSAYANRPDVLVLGLPRGGVVVAYEIARALNVPLDVCLVRKLGVPGHEELAMGAVGAVAVDGVRVLNEDIIRELGISKKVIEQTAATELRILEQRNLLYRKYRPPHKTKGRIVILVDDGLATGATMRAAIAALRHGSQRPARIVVAIPTAAPETCEELCKEADKFICLMAPHPFFAISQWYDDFEPTSDETVCELLEQATKEYRNELQRQAAGLPA